VRFLVGAICVVWVVLLGGCGSDDPAEIGPIGDDDGEDVTPPATVADLRCQSPTKVSLALVWTAPGDDGKTGTASAYDIRYATAPITPGNWDAATPLTDVPSPQSANTIETIRVLDLDASTDYYFALTATDEVGNASEMSNAAHGLTAKELVPPGAVGDLVVVAVDESSYRLSWTAPGDDGHEGTAHEYDVRYFTRPITENNWDDAAPAAGEPAPGTAGAEETFVATGIDPSPIYYFAMKTADKSSNWSELSNVFVELEYGRSLWVRPTNIYYNSDKTVIDVIYRAVDGEPLSLVLDYLPLSERIKYSDECGTISPWDYLEPVTGVTGTLVTQYDFAGRVDYGMLLYVVLCKNEEFVDEVQVFLRQ